MPSAASFAEVLDQELARLAADVAEAEVAPTTAPMLGLPPAPFVPFTPFDIPFLHRPTAYGASSRGQSTSGEARARLALESTSPRPADFTATELRAAFHQLAREYHPDRHPDATGAEALQYARTFTTVASNYRRLGRVVARRASEASRARQY